MKVVYVAGPFRGPNHWVMAENVRNAERWGVELTKLGVMPLIPHAITAHFYGLADEKFFLDGTIELLRRSDAAVFIPGWHNSSGSVGEHEFCARHRKPFLELDGFAGPGTPTEHVKKLERFVKTLGV